MMTRVLVIEDSDQLRMIATRFLKWGGFDVLEASKGSAGLAMFAEHGADVLLTDVHLGDLNGNDVIRSLRMARASLPVVVMTGSVQGLPGARIVDADLESSVSLLYKPFTQAQLSASIEDAVARRPLGAPDAE
ncbi:MAG: response regulator [Gemmatimonadaceae bacterium]